GLGPLERDEQPAVRALVALRAGRGMGGEQLALELLPAVRAHDAGLLAHEVEGTKPQAGAGGSNRSSSSPTRTASRAARAACAAAKATRVFVYSTTRQT